MRKNYRKILEPKWLLTGMFFVSGLFLGALTIYLLLSSSPTVFKIHPPKSDYKFINPLLGVEVQTNGLFVANKPLGGIIQGLINTEKGKKDITDASVYYRNMELGDWVGINEDTEFSPGKLLKLPIMIAYYKLAENDPEVLSQEIINNYPLTPATEFSPSPKPFVVGGTYSVDELINRMIVNNDDTAANLLFDHVDKGALGEVFSDLGVNFEEDKNTPDFISLKLNSLFFRVLYNSTYLNREYSEKALALLGEVNDSTGLGAGIPKTVTVARRFGGSKTTENGVTEYHSYDCGIVYYPDHPYLLCVSATGGTPEGIETFLKALGEKVYTETKYNYKG